ncbi:hypothetical protein FOMPIDRAFT_1055237 [Fomitopsis schrenkii]|uniref:non-chaperonin molecular chaperone ATPase n=1 Tax=Fomitopsis schrenkii TaxID=2126942 RepID=S8F5Y0_FOMSC|nr:hypothetical protein FOMPIDRAFT_1055237 [Fomitopsis schrenkii]
MEIIANDQGHRITPSWVSFTDEECLRLIGRKVDDPEIKRDMKHWPFKITSKNDKPVIQVKYRSETREFTPEEISAMVLTKMKETAEA